MKVSLQIYYLFFLKNNEKEPLNLHLEIWDLLNIFEKSISHGIEFLNLNDLKVSDMEEDKDTKTADSSSIFNFHSTKPTGLF